MTALPVLDDQAIVRRYMPFSRLVWMLAKKKLWLSRADRLGDEWEGTVHRDQLDSGVGPASMTPVGVPIAISHRGSNKVVDYIRTHTFVSCWSASQHESHALWRIYCPSGDGIAIETTLGRLRMSVPQCEVRPVIYDPSSMTSPPDPREFITRKRPMFNYESEVRIVHTVESETRAVGMAIDWDPENAIAGVRSHPEGGEALFEALVYVVRQFAPSIPGLARSAMTTPPPIWY